MGYLKNGEWFDEWDHNDEDSGAFERDESAFRLWVTLIRFDPVYHVHFKCNVRRIADYPNLAALTRRLYELEGVSGRVNFHHIRHHYYESQEHLNPHGIVPAGPDPMMPDGRSA